VIAGIVQAAGGGRRFGGPKQLAADARVRTVDCEGLGSPADVDTAEQLSELERSLRRR
jgi:molybdopterin/thiamine biosynthesis adenylyltransferase